VGTGQVLIRINGTTEILSGDNGGRY